MIDPERLAAFAMVTGLTSMMPGPQMLFLLTQTLWRGAHSGLAALAGMQIGNATWFALAGLGLSTLAKAAPGVFTALTLFGAGYLGWMGIKALRHSRARPAGEQPDTAPARPVSAHAFRDSIVVSLSNPKSLIYVLALLPPFVDGRAPVTPQLLPLAGVALSLDTLVGLGYITAGHGLARRMQEPSVRQRVDRVVGTVFVLLAAAVVWSVVADFGTPD